MKFGVVNKSTILNRFVLHTLQRNITHLAVITRKTNIKLVILKGGEAGKEPVDPKISLSVLSKFVILYIRCDKIIIGETRSFFLSFFFSFLLS